MIMIIRLPPHITCASHSLNLIATTDAEKTVDKCAVYKKTSRSAFAKCQSFWNKLSRSTSVADTVFEICKKRFPVPIITRWNSWYDAISKLISEKTKVNESMEKLDMSKLKSTEWDFLTEYCQFMQPLAMALDKLQGEKKNFLGMQNVSIFFFFKLIYHPFF